jgi:hypothetical protein
MGAARKRGTKEQRIAEAILKQEETVEEIVKNFPELSYMENIRQHNIKVMIQALKGLPDDYI